MEFVQVRVRTNIAPSNAFGQVQMLQEIVLGRLRGRIRRLFDVGAVIRVETRGMRGDAVDVRFNFVGWLPMGKIFPSQNCTQSHPQRGILPSPNKLYPAIAPRRRRIPSGAARERSSHVLDGTTLVSNRTCTNYIHIPFS